MHSRTVIVTQLDVTSVIRMLSNNGLDGCHVWGCLFSSALLLLFSTSECVPWSEFGGATFLLASGQEEVLLLVGRRVVEAVELLSFVLSSVSSLSRLGTLASRTPSVGVLLQRFSGPSSKSLMLLSVELALEDLPDTSWVSTVPVGDSIWFDLELIDAPSPPANFSRFSSVWGLSSVFLCGVVFWASLLINETRNVCYR